MANIHFGCSSLVLRSINRGVINLKTVGCITIVEVLLYRLTNKEYIESTFTNHNIDMHNTRVLALVI